MKSESKFKLRVFMIVIAGIFLAFAFAISTYDKKGENFELLGEGVDCFRLCSNFCSSNDGAPKQLISWTAYEGECGCTCDNGNQEFFDVEE